MSAPKLQALLEAALSDGTVAVRVKRRVDGKTTVEPAAPIAAEGYTVEDETRDDAEIAAELVGAGWKSVSNKRQIIARLPEGKTGLEALRECSPLEYAKLVADLEHRAADVYRRVYASVSAGTKRVLDADMFAAFKRAGGESSW